MAIPAITDFVLYTTTPLTNADWAANWNKTVAYLTTTYDVTFNSLTVKPASDSSSVVNVKNAANTSIVSVNTTTSTMNAVNILASGVVTAASFVGALSNPSKIGYFERGMSAASGTQAITGVGYKPSLVIFLSYVLWDTSFNLGIGFDNGVQPGCFTSLNNAQIDRNYSLTFAGSSGGQHGVISSFDSDGFTITWLKSGSGITGTANILYLAFH